MVNIRKSIEENHETYDPLRSSLYTSLMESDRRAREIRRKRREKLFDRAFVIINTVIALLALLWAVFTYLVR